MPPRPFRLDDLYAIQIPSDPQLSPDGRFVAFVLSTADRDSDQRRSTIWLIPSAGGSARQVTAGHQDSAPRFSPDGRHLLYLSASDGKPPQLWTLPLTGGDAAQLTSLPLGAGAGVWSPDGTMIAWTSIVDAGPLVGNPDISPRPVVIEDFGYKLDGFGLRRSLREQLFVQAATGGPARQVTDTDVDHTGPVWSPDSRRIAVSMPDYTAYGTVLCPQRVGVIEVETRMLTMVTPPDAMLTVVDWSPDGDELLLVGADHSGLAEPRLWTCEARGGQAPRELLLGHPGNHMPGWQLDVPARFSPDGSCVRFGEWRHGRTRLLEAPASGGAPRQLAGGTRTVRAAAYGTHATVFVAADQQRIAELYLDDGHAERQLTQLHESSLAEVDFVKPVDRVFDAPDGQRIHGYVLRRDDTDGPGPLLVDIHGGPYNAWLPALSEHFLHQQVLAGQGWTVLCVDPRGSASYGESFMQATTGSWGYADEGDVLGAVDVLVAEGLADPTRLAVSGFSYGGYLTAWLTTRTSRFAAAICGVMVCDQVSWQGTDAGPMMSELIAGGPMWEAFDRLTDCSPIRHVGKVTTPTLILQAEDDLRTPMAQGELWFQALRSRGVRVRLVRYPQATHYSLLTGAPSLARDMYQRLVDWATEHTCTASAGLDESR